MYFREHLCKLLQQGMVILLAICRLASVSKCLWTMLLSPFLVCTVCPFAVCFVLSNVCKYEKVKFITAKI